MYAIYSPAHFNQVVIGVSVIVEKLTLYQVNGLKIFFLFYGPPFHSVDCFFVVDIFLVCCKPTYLCLVLLFVRLM